MCIAMIVGFTLHTQLAAVTRTAGLPQLRPAHVRTGVEAPLLAVGAPQARRPVHRRVGHGQPVGACGGGVGRGERRRVDPPPLRQSDQLCPSHAARRSSSPASAPP